jgi:hypothetical protein
MNKGLLTLATAGIYSLAFFLGESDGQQKTSPEPLKGGITVTPPERLKPDVWMKRKLEFSQEILAGLTEGDFQKVNDYAHMLNFVGYLSAWLRAEEPDYKRQVTYFEFAAKELIRQSKEKNVDGATLAYNQLTTSCVQCHKVVRAKK